MEERSLRCCLVGGQEIERQNRDLRLRRGGRHDLFTRERADDEFRARVLGGLQGVGYGERAGVVKAQWPTRRCGGGVVRTQQPIAQLGTGRRIAPG